MQLGQHYRFVAENRTTQTLAANAVRVRTRRWRWASDGSVTLEAAEAEVLNNAATIADLAFAAGATQVNVTDKWIGGDFGWEATAPTGANGDVLLYYQESTDGGTTWPDLDLGRLVGILNFTAAGTKRDNPLV